MERATGKVARSVSNGHRLYRLRRPPEANAWGFIPAGRFGLHHASVGELDRPRGLPSIQLGFENQESHPIGMGNAIESSARSRYQAKDMRAVFLHDSGPNALHRQ
jgi:hypothetical protein